MSWSDGLLPEQETAVTHTGTNARLLAGPGTGKTRTLTSRIAYLASELDVPHENILALTFTRAAAGELRSRVADMLSGTSSDLPQIATLHSFALQTILQHGAGNRLPSPIRIADDYEERWIIEEDLKRILELDRVEEARVLIQRLSADWETLAADEAEWAVRFPDPRFITAWREHRAIYGYTLRAELVYQLKLALEEGAIELADAPSHLLVDEYQDLNACDLSVINSMTRSGAELYVAGDDDQSIYGFRGAEPEGIRRFIREYPGSADLTLTECRRCAPNILEIALYVARQDTERIDKPLNPYTTSGPGNVHLLRFEDYTTEAVAIAKIARWLVDSNNITVDRILVLLRSDRNLGFSTPIRVAFEAEGLPASAVEDPFSVLDTSNGRILLSMFRLMSDERDNLAWRTLITQRDNRLGTSACSAIYDLARRRGGTFYLTLGLIAGEPGLLPRQGSLIKMEYEEILNELDQLQGALEEIGAMRDFVDWTFATFVASEDSDGILEVLGEVIAQNGVTSLDELLQALTTPIRDAEQVRVPGAINIMTMHQAKGLDADAVFVVGAEDEYVPGRAEGLRIDDERRLLHVSLTRARTQLYITHCTRRKGGQRHTGRTSGSVARLLTRFLSGGPIISRLGSEYLDEIGA